MHISYIVYQKCFVFVEKSDKWTVTECYRHLSYRILIKYLYRGHLCCTVFQIKIHRKVKKVKKVEKVGILSLTRTLHTEMMKMETDKIVDETNSNSSTQQQVRINRFLFGFFFFFVICFSMVSLGLIRFLTVHGISIFYLFRFYSSFDSLTRRYCRW